MIKCVYCVLTCLAGIAIYAPTDIKSQTHIFYNFTPSAPIGFYKTSQENFKKGSWVVIRFDLRYLKFSHDTTVKQHVKLLKPVAALQDDRICRSQTALYINGKFASHISHKQNALFNKAHKTGCYTLNSDEIIVLSSHENALDSRSFGILRKTDIISIVKPVIVLYH